jgi:hypothetical protein
MEWLGHVVKMEGIRLAKNILKSKSVKRKREKSVDTNNYILMTSKLIRTLTLILLTWRMG